MKGATTLFLAGFIGILALCWAVSAIYSSYEYRKVSLELLNTKNKLKELNASLYLVQQNLSVERDKTLDLSDRLKECERRLGYFVSSVEIAKGNISTLQSQLLQLQSEKDYLTEELSSINASYIACKEELDEISTNLTEKQDLLKMLCGNATCLFMKIDSVINEIDDNNVNISEESYDDLVYVKDRLMNLTKLCGDLSNVPGCS